MQTERPEFSSNNGPSKSVASDQKDTLLAKTRRSIKNTSALTHPEKRRALAILASRNKHHSIRGRNLSSYAQALLDCNFG